MSSYRGIKSRSRRRKANKGFELQLTSMMDAMVIIVIFLLKSYTISANNFTGAAGLDLPISASQEVPQDSIEITVTRDELKVNQTSVLSLRTDRLAFKPSDLDRDNKIVPLYVELSRLKQLQMQAAENGKAVASEGILAIQADKNVPYDTIRKIMVTSANAGFKAFRFLAMKKEN